MPVAPVFPPLTHPVVPPAGAAVVLATVEPDAAKAIVERVVRDPVVRPFDIGVARIGEPRPLWIPFWRVDVRVDALHLDVTEVEVGRDRRRVPVPTGASRFRGAQLMLPARTAFPYEARLRSLVGPPPLEVADDEITTTDVAAALAGVNAEIVDPDVTRDRAESLALGLLISRVSPTHAFHATFEPRVEGSVFCWYPVYHAPYAYSGEGRSRDDAAYFVSISARTGQVLAEGHPSAVRATLAKVRRVLSFDYRRY